MVKEESANAKLTDWVVPLTLLTKTFSMPVSVTPAVVPAKVPVTETFNVSVPVPPLSASPAANVVPVVLAAPVLTITPLKVSAPELPVKLVPPSTPVVSVLNWFPEKFNKHRHLACSHGLVFCVPPPFSDQNASKQAVER